MIYWLYCIENKANGKKYIGKTNNVKIRFKSHLAIAAGGKEKYPKHFQYIHAAINKYGKENFWFGCIDFCFSEEDALVQEIFWIQFHKTRNYARGYNLTDGGEGISGYKHTQKTRNALSEYAKLKIGKLNSFYGKKHSSDVVLKSTGENNKQAKLKEFQVVDLLSMYCTGKFIEEDLAVIFDIKRQTVNDILRGKRWKHIKRDNDKILEVKLLNKSRKNK